MLSNRVFALRSLRSTCMFSMQTSVKAVAGLSKIRCFHSLGLNPTLVNRLTTLGLTRPTLIQTKAIPLILSGKDVVLAAETGGGKTLAFLLPLIQHLGQIPVPFHDMRQPAALVLTTSQELVRQLLSVLHQLDPNLADFAGNLSTSRQNLKTRACPVVFATPGTLLRETKPTDFAFTQMIIVDEADMLLSGGYEKQTKQILATVRNQPLLRSELNSWKVGDRTNRPVQPEDFAVGQRTQTILSAATIPDYGKRSVRHFIDYMFPSAVFATTKNFHRTLPTLTLRVKNLQDFMARRNLSDKQQARCELLYEILTSTGEDDGQKSLTSGKTLVFANSIASADALFDFLHHDKNMTNCALFHKEIDRPHRQALLDRLDSEAENDQNLVVICTDIAARGLDTTKVNHVVQFEFASDVVTFLHRIGRTGRAGTAGTVTSIASSENSLVLAKIREAGSSTLQNAFSRKRSLRKKFKKSQRTQKTPPRVA